MPSFWRLTRVEGPVELWKLLYSRQVNLDTEDYWLVQDFWKAKIVFRVSTGVPQELHSPINSYTSVLLISHPMKQTENKGIMNTSKLMSESEFTMNIQTWLTDCGRLVQKFTNVYRNNNAQIFIVVSWPSTLLSALFSRLSSQ